MTDKLYSLEQAKILGKRAVCEDGEGHLLVTKRQKTVSGKVVVNSTYCKNCDVKVRFTYPDLPDA